MLEVTQPEWYIHTSLLKSRLLLTVVLTVFPPLGDAHYQYAYICFILSIRLLFHFTVYFNLCYINEYLLPGFYCYKLFQLILLHFHLCALRSMSVDIFSEMKSHAPRIFALVVYIAVSRKLHRFVLPPTVHFPHISVCM